MWGIMKKDLFTLKRQGKMLGFLAIIYIMMAYFGETPTIMTSIIVIIALMMPITCMAYEERCKWGAYANALPVSKKIQVAEKYIFPVVLAVVGAAVSLPVSWAIVLIKQIRMTFFELLLGSVGVICVGLLILAIMLPVMYAFGVEKGRIALFGVCAAFGLIGLGVGSFAGKQQGGPPQLITQISEYVDRHVLMVAIVSVAVCALLYITSFFVSASIEKKKEY